MRHLFIALVFIFCSSFKPADDDDFIIEISKTDCSSDNANYNLVLLRQVKQYKLELNSFSKCEEVFDGYTEDRMYLERFKCSGKYKYWHYGNDFKFLVSRSLFSKPANQETTFILRVFKKGYYYDDVKLVATLYNVKTDEETTIDSSKW